MSNKVLLNRTESQYMSTANVNMQEHVKDQQLSKIGTVVQLMQKRNVY